MRTLYIHVGAAKTGTTAIQNFLRDHDNSSVIYPKVGLWRDGSHHNLILNYFGDYERPEIVPKDAGEMLDQIARDAKQLPGNVVISSEQLAPRPGITEFAEDLLSRLGTDFRVCFIVVVREHISRIGSNYNQEVKDSFFRECRDPGKYLSDRTTEFTYAPLARRLMSSRFDLDVLSYHPQNDFVRRFLTHIGFPADRIAGILMRNVSLCRKALIAMLAVNRNVEDTHNIEIYNAALRRMKMVFSPSPLIFEPEDVAGVEHEISADREFLRRKFNIELPSAQLAARPNAFRISREEFDDVSSALTGVGPEYRKILGAINEYIMPGARGAGDGA
jgi:hypothetical protein